MQFTSNVLKNLPVEGTRSLTSISSLTSARGRDLSRNVGLNDFRQACQFTSDRVIRDLFEERRAGGD